MSWIHASVKIDNGTGIPQTLRGVYEFGEMTGAPRDKNGYLPFLEEGMDNPSWLPHRRIIRITDDKVQDDSR